MKLSYIILLIALLFQMVCATASQLAVSPYIHSGLSFSLSGKFNPTYVELVDESPSPLSDMDEGLCSIYPEILFSYGIESSVEISLVSIPLLMGYRGRLNVTILNNNENPLLFKNCALSAFVGGNRSLSILSNDIDIDQAYGGVSIGTKAFFSTKKSLELFASPMVVYTHYRLFANFQDDRGTPSIIVRELDVPLAVRITFVRKRKISIKVGGTISFLLSQDAKETKYDNDGYTTTLNHIPISIFTEVAWHFGRRKENKERRKQLLQEELLIDLKEEEVKSVQ